MESDRELLLLAAKAASIEIERDGSAIFFYDENGNVWSPLEDDGDALRLAVKLRISIRLEDAAGALAGIAAYQDGAPTFDGKGPWFRKEWNKDSGPYTATRRAIVRAAAEIGKTLG